MIPFFDPPHLLKGIRNNLLSKDLEVGWENKKSKEDRKYASWIIIEKAYQIDISNSLFERNLPKLTSEHIHASKIKKMRVKNAAQVLSRSVAAFIGVLSNTGGEYTYTQRNLLLFLPK